LSAAWYRGRNASVRIPAKLNTQIGPS